MTEIEIRGDELDQAAAVLGIPAGDCGRAELACRIIRQVAAGAALPAAGEKEARRRNAVADGGGAPKRAGRRMEINVVEHARARGFTTWDRAPLRGSRDLLDLTGTIPDGWLIGTKAVSRTVNEGQKLSGAMDQAQRAMANLARGTGGCADVIPFQILQRPGAPVGRAYAVTEYDYLLRLAEMRRGWERGD